MKSGNIENFQHLSKFGDITDFNNHIEQWMVDIKSKFTKSELVALKRLIRFSVKVAGVCNAKIGTVVSATHDKDGVGISRSTFKRMVGKAKEIGLLIVRETVRKNGSKSSNVYVFNRFETAELSFTDGTEPSKDEKLNQPQTINLSKTINIKKINKRIDNGNSKMFKNKQFGKEFVNPNIPEEFVNLVSCFYGDFQTIEEFWRMTKIAEHKSGYNLTDFDLLDASLESIRETVKALKLNKVKKNVFAFFFGCMQKILKGLYMEFYMPESKAPTYSVIPMIPAVTNDTFATPEELNAMEIY